MWEGLCTICWFYFVRQELLILGFWRTRIVDSTQIENHFGNTHSHFVDQKQQNGSPNQQNGSLRNNKVGNRSCIQHPTGAADRLGQLLPKWCQPWLKEVLTTNQTCSLNLKVAQHWWEGRMVSSQQSISVSHNSSPPLNLLHFHNVSGSEIGWEVLHSIYQLC